MKIRHRQQRCHLFWKKILLRGTQESQAIEMAHMTYDRRFTLEGVGEVSVKVPLDRVCGFQTRMIPRSKQYEEELVGDMSMMFLVGISYRSLSMLPRLLIGRSISVTEIIVSSVLIDTL